MQRQVWREGCGWLRWPAGFLCFRGGGVLEQRCGAAGWTEGVERDRDGWYVFNFPTNINIR
jgi:hypothetical protein